MSRQLLRSVDTGPGSASALDILRSTGLLENPLHRTQDRKSTTHTYPLEPNHKNTQKHPKTKHQVLNSPKINV